MIFFTTLTKSVRRIARRLIGCRAKKFMKAYKDFTREELLREQKELLQEFDLCKEKNLSLNMMRGNPSPNQLDLSCTMFDGLYERTKFRAEDGSDCRNYGVPTGIPEAKRLFAQILKTSADKIFIGGSSSLTLMFDTLMRSMVFGEHDSPKPWCQVEGRKWLCPAPGYDRHFRITEKLGFELIPVPMTEEGPDMELVEKLAGEDECVLGMWCVPLYSNPDGVVYSEQTCRAIAAMKCAAPDFRVMWDNAYAVHHLYEDRQGSIPDILSLAEQEGNPSRFYEFASTSKVTFAGGGISCLAANRENLEYAQKLISVQSICNDKINQLAHADFLKDLDGVKEQMRRQSAVLRPKFEKVLEILQRDLASTGAATWKNPLGGYFVSVYVYPGTADQVVGLCKQLGVSLTAAGATYPYGKDPDNSNIRIAPSFPSLQDLEQATEIFTLCTRLAAVNKLLETEK